MRLTEGNEHKDVKTSHLLEAGGRCESDLTHQYSVHKI